MNTLQINIGLNNLPERYHNPYTGTVDAQLIVDLCKALFYQQPSNAPKGKETDLKYTIKDGEYLGEIEPTLVLEGLTLEKFIADEISLLAGLLGQECIAYKINGNGNLVFSPYEFDNKLAVYDSDAYPSGEFDSKYFLEL